MGRKRQKFSPGKTMKKLKLSTPDTTSHQSNLNFNCNKEVVIQIERLSESVVAEMTAGWSALPPEQTKKKLKLPSPKKKSCPSNPHLICNKEVVIQLERLSDSVIAEMTAGGSALPPEQVIAELEQVKEERARDKINFETEKCELESKINKYEEQCTELQSEKEKLQSENEKLRNEIKKLQSENENIQSENEKLQSENKRLQKRLQDLESSNINAEEKSQMNLYNTDLNRQITKVTAELEQVKEEHACDKIHFETENCELKSEIEKYKEQCTELQSENERLQKYLQDLESTKINVGEKSQVTAELEQLKEEHARNKLNFEIEKWELESKIDRYKEQCTELQMENERLQKYLQNLESANIVEENSQINLYNTGLTSQITKIGENLRSDRSSTPCTDGSNSDDNNSDDNMVEELNEDAFDINSLPEEIILRIFGHLEQNQLGRIRRVCKRWNVLTRSPTLWKEVNVNFHYSHESQSTVTRCFVKILPPCVTRIRINFLSIIGGWSEYLNFEELCVRLQKSCPCLKILIFKCAILSNNLSSIIDLCTQFLPDVKILVFNHSRFSACRLTDNPGGFSKIEILVISDCDFSFDHFVYEYLDFVNKPPFSRMPYLKQLHLFGSDVDDSWFQGDTSFLNQLHVLDLGCTNIPFRTFLTLQNHGHNLKKLYLCEINLQVHDVNFSNSAFSHLETICIRDSFGRCEPIISLIQSCQSLQNVYVNDGMAKTLAAHPYVAANRCMSEIVKAIDPDHRHNVDYLHN